MTDDLRELLYRSFDTELSARDRRRLDEALAASAALRAERDQIEALRRAVTRAAPEGFGPGFAARVAERLRPEAGRDRISESWLAAFRAMFRWVAIPAASVCAALIIWNIQLNGFSTASTDPAAALWQTPLQTLLGDQP